MQKLAVVYFLKGNLDELTLFRQKYDPQWQIIPLHITIVFPLTDISEEQLISHIEKIIKNVKSLPITLYGLVKSFDHCLFLQVQERNEDIINLHKKLYSGILQPFLKTDMPFSPHVTIGYFGNEKDELNKELYDKAFAEAEKMNINLTCNFDKLTLIKGDGMSPAKTIKTFVLN